MEILQLHTSIPRQRARIEQFLAASGLRLDEVDYYAALVDEESGDIIAGGGLWRDIIKCVAVADGHQGEALANTIVSHLIARANAEGHHCVKLYTKPQNRQLFESLSFRLLAEAPQAILMETGVGGIGKYSQALRLISAERQAAAAASASLPQAGVIVMNANPFTLGHRRLVEQAAAQVGTLYVLIVKEDCSVFSYAERKDMVSRGVADLANVCVVDGSDYAVSKATFPTYFLKRLSDASDTQMLLDLDLYGRHIAPALGATVRFVGSEPTDALTCRYNKLMQATLPNVRVMQRYEVDGEPVSASRVRMALVKNNLSAAAPLVPPTTLPYLIAHLATRALRTELNTTPKPGLVDSRDNGSHTDMDHAIMMRGIRALHPFFVRLALLGYAPQLPPHGEVVGIGLEAERAMLAATGASTPTRVPSSPWAWPSSQRPTRQPTRPPWAPIRPPSCPPPSRPWPPTSPTRRAPMAVGPRWKRRRWRPSRARSTTHARATHASSPTGCPSTPHGGAPTTPMRPTARCCASWPSSTTPTSCTARRSTR